MDVDLPRLSETMDAVDSFGSNQLMKSICDDLLVLTLVLSARIPPAVEQPDVVSSYH